MPQCVVGVPKEVKYHEGRVGLTPHAVRAITALGAGVLVERGAGLQSSYSDRAFESSGAIIVDSPEGIWGNSDIVVKVKEPIPSEYQQLLLMGGKTLFTYLHLAGSPIELTRALMRNEVTAIAYETVSTKDEKGRPIFPLLVPMSVIAGTQSMRGAIAHQSKEKELFVLIIGGGNVGEAALAHALTRVSSIVLFEAWDVRVRELKEKYRGHDKVTIFPLTTLEEPIGKNYLRMADIVICGPMLPGGKEAPIVLTQKHFRIMKRGCYVADVSIDQGGSTVWTHEHPTKPGETFTRGARDLIFSAVPNIPGSTVPDEATKALTAATLPYVLDMVRQRLAGHDDERTVLRENLALRLGLQTYHGVITNEHVAQHHGLMSEYKPLDVLF